MSIGILRKFKKKKKMDFADKIKTLCLRYGFNQSTLAQQIRVDQKSISNWMAGKSVPRNRNIKELAELFNVSPETLANNALDLPSNSEHKIITMGKNMPPPPVETAEAIQKLVKELETLKTQNELLRELLESSYKFSRKDLADSHKWVKSKRETQKHEAQ